MRQIKFHPEEKISVFTNISLFGSEGTLFSGGLAIVTGNGRREAFAFTLKRTLMGNRH